MPDKEQKYRIIERLDSGGMAEIYRAEADLIHGMKKTVAVKRVLPDLTRNKKFVAMFLDEARLSLHLAHANIVQVFDIGRHDDSFFIVMEYVDGVNLRSLAKSLERRNKSIGLGPAIFIAMETCKGLGYAHDAVNMKTGEPQNIVHRDVSPPNILMSKNGEIKLVDFGLAKAASQLEQTDPGIVKGKFSYLCPEATLGEEVDRRADIFAVGIILYEMLTGTRLFLGATDLETVELIRDAKIPDMRKINSKIPKEVAQIVYKLLAKNPDDRFGNAYDVQEALAHVLFDRGLKVTSRDIARLVVDAQEERSRSGIRKPAVKGQRMIDTLIQEEVVKFESIDNSGASQTGAQPLRPEDLHSTNISRLSSLSAPSKSQKGVDTRSWSDDFGSARFRKNSGAINSSVEPSRDDLKHQRSGSAFDDDDVTRLHTETSSSMSVNRKRDSRGRGKKRRSKGGLFSAIGIGVGLVLLLVVATLFILSQTGAIDLTSLL